MKKSHLRVVFLLILEVMETYLTETSECSWAILMIAWALIFDDSLWQVISCPIAIGFISPYAPTVPVLTFPARL